MGIANNRIENKRKMRNHTICAPEYATGSYGKTHHDEGMLRFFWGKGCRSMLDVGCGPGGHVRIANSLGYRAMGIEVDPIFYRHMHVALIDCCVEPFILPEPADLVWSNEVAEHIPRKCVDNYLATLTGNAAKYICMTANQHRGKLHISVYPLNWWQEKMADLGWHFCPDSARVILENSSMEREFMRETGMIFKSRS